MFNSGILDTLIGVVMIFLLLSLICTMVNELIALWLKKRAKELEKGIGKLLTSPQLLDKFYTHPLIKGLCPDERKPSYIPSRTFALALMDIVRRHSFDGTVTAAIQAVADKEKARFSAQASFDAADTAFKEAEKVRKAAEAAATSAGAADLLAASKAAENAANQEAATIAAKMDAQIKLKAAEDAKKEAEDYLIRVTADAKVAKDAETSAQLAETAAKENPKDAALQTVAADARKKANEAADNLAPSASSLLTGARDKIAGVQSDVVPPELKAALLALMDNAGTNLNKAQANLEQWFDDSMDRVSGVYKRKSQVFIVIIAVLVTLLANADTLQIANSLSHDKAVRDSLVAAAPQLAKKAEPTPTAAPTPPPPGTGTSGEGSSAGAEGGSGAKPPESTTTPEPSITSIRASLDELNKLGLPVGYIRVCTAHEELAVDTCGPAAEARVKQTETQIDKAEADLTKAEADLKKAEEDLQKAFTDVKRVQDDQKATTDDKTAAAQLVLSKAEKNRDKASKARDRAGAEVKRADAELKKANVANAKAVAAADIVEQIQTNLETAETELRKDPNDKTKQQTAEEARRKAALAIECPKCSKASELTNDELKRRLPTTHDYQLVSKDFFNAFGALLGDSWNLLYSHWLGWLITALAVSLGAPFWFDTLNRLMVIRSTVKPHEKSKEQESKDNPDEDDGKKKT
jgi:hypothetical protein